MKKALVPATAFLSLLLVYCCGRVQSRESAPGAAAQTETGSGEMERFEAQLSGDSEVPPIQVGARGQADFEVADNGRSIEYKLTVENAEDITMAHLHIGGSMENGPHVVWLYPSPTMQRPEEKPGEFSGVLAEGTFDGSDMIGEMKGKPLADLVKDMKEGRVYVNVHGTNHPDGEIRGQLEPEK